LSTISDNPLHDPHLKDVDLFLAADDSIPPGIENDENDLRRNFIEEIHDDDLLSEAHSFLFDLPSSRPPVKPPM
jgi:hypothetical protein